MSTNGHVTLDIVFAHWDGTNSQPGPLGAGHDVSGLVMLCYVHSDPLYARNREGLTLVHSENERFVEARARKQPPGCILASILESLCLLGRKELENMLQEAF